MPHTDAGMKLFEGGHERRIKRLQRRNELVELLDAALNVSSVNVASPVPVIQIERPPLSSSS